MENISCLIKYETFGDYTKIPIPKNFHSLISFISKVLYPNNFSINWLNNYETSQIANESDYCEIIKYLLVNKINEFKLFVYLYDINKKNCLPVIVEVDEDEESLVTYNKCVKCKS
jgi:hypothetical protein